MQCIAVPPSACSDHSSAPFAFLCFSPQVFGMTRGGAKIVATVQANGAEPVLGNYTVGADIAKALKETGARKVFVLTDFIGAAKGKAAVEVSTSGGAKGR